MDKSDSKEEPETGKRKAQVLAVWGSPGCGKTTISVKIAKYLAEKKKNVILVISGYDRTHDSLYMPGWTSWKTYGPWEMYLQRRILQKGLIEENCIVHKKIKYLAMLGMLRGENEYTYAPS